MSGTLGICRSVASDAIATTYSLKASRGVTKGAEPRVCGRHGPICGILGT